MDHSNRQDSLVAALSDKLYDEATADFTIICRGPAPDHHRKFRVHKFILSLRSDYFRRLFSAGNFKENTSNELVLIPKESAHETATFDDDDHPLLMHALLTAMYKDQLIDAEKANEDLGSRLADQELVGSVKFFGRLSALADRFAFTGLDSLIADCCFNGLTSDADEANIVYSGVGVNEISCRLRVDDEFIDTLCTVFTNSKRNGSTYAASLTVALAVDYLHFLQQYPQQWQKLVSCPGMESAILQEITHGEVRLMCIHCGIVSRVERKSFYLSMESGIRSKVCDNCGKSNYAGSMLLYWQADPTKVALWRLSAAQFLRKDQQ